MMIVRWDLVTEMSLNMEGVSLMNKPTFPTKTEN